MTKTAVVAKILTWATQSLIPTNIYKPPVMSQKASSWNC